MASSLSKVLLKIMSAPIDGLTDFDTTTIFQAVALVIRA